MSHPDPSFDPSEPNVKEEDIPEIVFDEESGYIKESQSLDITLAKKYLAESIAYLRENLGDTSTAFLIKESFETIKEHIDLPF